MCCLLVCRDVGRPITVASVDCRSYCLSTPPSCCIPNRWINEDLLKEEFGSSKGISRRTAHNWMQELGFKWSMHQKCVYVDGHNRPDVLEARAGYVADMLAFRERMSM